MRLLPLVVPGLLLLVPLGLLAACGDSQPPPTPAPSADVWRGDGTWIEVEVDDLHCEGCENTMRRVLSAVDGVEEVEADADSDLVRVRLEDAGARDAVIPYLRDAIHGAHKKVVGEDEVAE